MRFAGYIRVSTERQVEEGLGAEIQRQAIRRWAKVEGHRIVEWFSDQGVSGSNGLDARVALPEAVALVRSQKAGGIVVYRLDRLARDLILQETLLREVRRVGGDIASTFASEAENLKDDPDDPNRRLIRHILGAISDWERAIIALRLRSGRRRKAEMGGFAYGSPPLGFRSVEGALVPDQEEQAVIERIRTLAESGKSVRSIAEELTVEGWRTKRGLGTWHPTVVARQIRRIETGGYSARGRPEGSEPSHERQRGMR